MTWFLIAISTVVMQGTAQTVVVSTRLEPLACVQVAKEMNARKYPFSRYFCARGIEI